MVWKLEKSEVKKQMMFSMYNCIYYLEIGSLDCPLILTLPLKMICFISKCFAKLLFI